MSLLVGQLSAGLLCGEQEENKCPSYSGVSLSQLCDKPNCVFQNSYVEAQTPSVIELGDTDCKD